MTQQELDAAYLREYVAFGANAPVTIANSLYSSLKEAHQSKGYEIVAHLQIRLFFEMVMSLETFGALLLGYSRWDKPGGLLGTLLAYAPGDVPQFIETIQNTDNVLSTLGFPDADTVRAHSPDTNVTDIAYTDDEAKSLIVDTCSMYLDPLIKTAFNKIKHGGLCIRNPEMLKPAPGKVVSGEDVYLITYSREKQYYEYPAFRVTGDAGLRHADKHLNNITVISERSSALAGFVAYFLENNLMRANERVVQKWESRLQGRVDKLYKFQTDSLVVPSENGGPLSYQNWLAYRENADWLYVQEFPLFTDAHITGTIPEENNVHITESDKRVLGPYAILNTVADREHAETVVGSVMRVAMHLDLSPKVDGSMDRTGESSYHGGGMNDELAAMLSLCMGVRFRPGRCVRDFYPNARDQKGAPRSIDLLDVPISRQRGKRMVIPSAAGPACLITGTALLERFVDMTPQDATILVKIARSYQEALWLAEIQPELSWLLFVQAIETAANEWSKNKDSATERIKDWGPGEDILANLEKAGLSDKQVGEFAELLAPYVGSFKKFHSFLEKFMPPAKSSRPPEIAQVDWSQKAMKKILRRIYTCRSNAVHNGQPFPSIMCEAPMKMKGGLAEKPLCSAASVYGATWKGDDIPMLLHTFEYIVRNALLRWWGSLLNEN